MLEDIDLEITPFIQRQQMWLKMRKRVGALDEALNETIRRYTASIMVPVTGNAVQKLGTSGFDPDGFMYRNGAFRFETRTSVHMLIVEGWLPIQHRNDVEITIRCRDCSITDKVQAGTLFQIALPIKLDSGTEELAEIQLSSAFQPSALSSDSGDTRMLGCIIIAAEFR